MPKRTVMLEKVRIKLLSIIALSRLKNENETELVILGAFKANNMRAPPTASMSIIRIKIPRSGSEAKACTEVKTPDRTRKVPSRHKKNVRIANNSVQILSVFRFSTTITECNRAVPNSQGMKLAFSTGSQNHHPPQPHS